MSQGHPTNLVPKVRSLEIHVTYRCTLRCPHCANCVSIAPCNEDMSIEWLMKLLVDSAALNYPWENLVLHGGEPCLHPHIETVYLMLQAYKSRWNTAVNLKITTNGYGPANPDAMKLAAAYGFEICDSHKDGTPQGYHYHTAIFNSPADNGEDWNEGCFQSSECGIAYTPRGFYECSPAGAAWRVMGYEPLCVDLKDLTPARLAEGFKVHCQHCGYARRVGHDGRDFVQDTSPPISKTWQAAIDACNRKHCP